MRFYVCYDACLFQSFRLLNRYDRSFCFPTKVPVCLVIQITQRYKCTLIEFYFVSLITLLNRYRFLNHLIVLYQLFLLSFANGRSILEGTFAWLYFIRYILSCCFCFFKNLIDLQILNNTCV